MNIKDELLAEGEKHKGTDLGGLLQMAAYRIDDLWEAMAEKDKEIAGMLDDCKKMHAGLIAIDAGANALYGMAFGAMPHRSYFVEEPEGVKPKRKKKVTAPACA